MKQKDKSIKRYDIKQEKLVNLFNIHYCFLNVFIRLLKIDFRKIWFNRWLCNLACRLISNGLN